jgi:hypothetical protein
VVAAAAAVAATAVEPIAHREEETALEALTM